MSLKAFDREDARLTQASGRRPCVAPAAVLLTDCGHGNTWVQVKAVVTLEGHLAADGVLVTVDAPVARRLWRRARNSCGSEKKNGIFTIPAATLAAAHFHSLSLITLNR